MGENASFQVLNISDILPNRFQPRIKFEDESLDELAESINRFGVIEPIVVRPIGNKYEIIAGERRYKASKLASKTTIPSIVISLSDKDSEELALLENVQRQSLNPIEEAVSYKRILDMGYITREELSKKIGKPQSVILNKTRLLNLADEVQSYLLNNKISERHARALLNITNMDDQVEMLHRIVNERLTVKKTNREIRNYLENNKNDDTETLFEDERGNDKVDIDKIMREAQDINVESNVNSQAPDLMAAPTAASQENNAQVFESTPDNTESVIPQEPNKFVNVQSTTESTSPVGNVINNENNGVSFDSMFSSSVNTQTPVNNISQETVVHPETVVSAPTINETQPIPGSEVNSSINDEISSIVSDALKNQPIVNQSPAENVQSTSLGNIPDFNINTSANNETIQVPMDNINKEADLSNQNSEVIAQNTTVDSTSLNLNGLIVNEQVSNNQGVLSTPVAETTILNNSGVSPTLQGNTTPEPQVDVSSSVPDFAKIVEKLRACADEIEKSGHFVNLEEVDLGNQYKVIFTFDK